MNIRPGAIVEFDYQLTSDEGVLLDSSTEQGPLEYLHGYRDIISGLEEALEGACEGQKIKVRIPPEKAYGEVLEELIQWVPQSVFEDVAEIEPGMQFEAVVQNGQLRKVMVKVITGESILVDGNHRLAGKWLNFDIEVRSIRSANEEELNTRNPQ